MTLALLLLTIYAAYILQLGLVRLAIFHIS